MSNGPSAIAMPELTNVCYQYNKQYNTYIALYNKH